MDFCKTPAITLRRTDYKDSSQIITFYTRDYGRIQTLAKGLKRSVKGISGGIDLLTYNNIVFIQRESSTLNILTEWVLRDDFHLLRKNSKNTIQPFIFLSWLESLLKKMIKTNISLIFS